MHVYGKIPDAEQSDATYFCQCSGKTEAIGDIGMIAPREHVETCITSHASGILYPSLAF